MALVVVVPGQLPAAPAGQSAQQRLSASVVSALRAVRGRVPSAAEISVVDIDDIFAATPASGAAVGVEEAILSSRRQTAARLVPQPREPEDGEAVAAETRSLSRYLTEPKPRHEARARVLGAVTPQTRVVVGHGLGALVAYEGLCAAEDASVTFVTMGAAMCGPAEVFNRLEPPPRDGQGQWPAPVRRWFNIVAQADAGAMTAPRLTDRFGPGIEDEIVELRGTDMGIGGYLLDRSAGRALSWGLG
jgi:hypothetical protein